jgi:tRNA1(Val) A37 N6-methylase TrmN6
MTDDREVIHDLLGYDGLKIIQRPDMFSFSLDSTLLADFVQIPRNTANLMDFGTGNAPIPLFLSLKTAIPIIGVEIQPEAFDLAIRSVLLNHLEEQITIRNLDINDLQETYSPGSIDFITCNPPFFKWSPDSRINKNDFLTIARHEVRIDMDSILRQAKLLLSHRGVFCMIHRAERLEEIVASLHVHGFALKRMRFVYPKKGRDANSVLIEARAGGAAGSLRILEPLIVYEDSGEYTAEILRLFRFGKKES